MHNEGESPVISLRFLVFFYDPKEERPNRLAVVTPLFTSPSAVKALMKTAKFENRSSLVVTGEKDNLEKLVSKVERLDVTDWLKLEDWDSIKSQLVSVVEGIEGLSVFETPDDESIVFGDEKITAKTAYPPDLPKGQEEIWDDVREKYKNLLKGNKDYREAVLRKLYNETAQRLGLVPFTFTSSNSEKKDLLVLLESGEKRAHDLLKKVARHALSEGVLKRVTNSKFSHSEVCHTKMSGFKLCHSLTWTLGTEKSWRDLVKFLTLKEAFHQVGPHLLTIKINAKTEIDIYDTKDQKVSVTIAHTLSQSDVRTLVGTEVSNPVRELNRLGRKWHEQGKIA